MTASYCVVGGGISGLTAAYRLRVAVGEDATITLFDPAEELGGVLRTIQLGGQPMDVGAEAFVARRPEVPALMAELGLGEALVDTTGARPLIYAGGRLHALPEKTVNGIPTSADSLAGLVDADTIAKVSGEAARPMSWRRGADPTVGEVVADRFGVQVVSRCVDPLLAGVYAGSAASIGLRSAAPGVAAALDRGAGSLTEAARAALPADSASAGPVFRAVGGGYRVLVDKLAQRGGVLWIRHAVTVLEGHPGAWRLRDSDGGSWRADAVVVAVPALRLAGLVAGVAPGAAAAAARIPVASSVVVALAVPADTELPERSGVLVAAGEPLHAKAITLSSRKWGQRGDLATLRMSFGRFGDDIVRSTGDDELVAWALDDLAAIFGVRAEPVETHVQRWPDSMPQYGPGHAALVADLRDGLPGTLALAGNYLEGIGVPACVASGAAAAAALVAGAVAP